MLLNKYIDLWLFGIKDTISTKTFDNYKYSCAIIKDYFENVPIESIDDNMLMEFFNHLYNKGYSDNTIATIRTHFNIVLNKAVKQKYILKNPLDEFVIKQHPTNKKHVDYTDLNGLTKVILAYMTQTDNPRALYMRCMYTAAYYFTLATGLPEKEIFALSWDDVIDDTLHINKTVSFPKSGSEIIYIPDDKITNRTVRLSKNGLLILEKWKLIYNNTFKNNYTDGIIFCNAVGEPIDITNMRKRWWNIVRKKADYENIRWKDLQTTAIVNFIKNGATADDLKQYLGITDNRTIDNYFNVYRKEFNK